MEKISYGILIRLNDALQRMSTLTGGYGLCIAKTKIAISDEIAVYRELLDNLIKKYGEDKDGKLSVSPEMDNWKAFLPEYEALLNTDAEVNIFKIKKEDFDIDKIYCEAATAEDYMFFKELMVES